jgi:hypothetical protein
MSAAACKTAIQIAATLRIKRTFSSRCGPVVDLKSQDGSPATSWVSFLSKRKPDLAISAAEGTSVAVLLGNGGGTFIHLQLCLRGISQYALIGVNIPRLSRGIFTVAAPQRGLFATD